MIDYQRPACKMKEGSRKPTRRMYVFVQGSAPMSPCPSFHLIRIIDMLPHSLPASPGDKVWLNIFLELIGLFEIRWKQNRAK